MPTKNANGSPLNFYERKAIKEKREKQVKHQINKHVSKTNILYKDRYSKLFTNKKHETYKIAFVIYKWMKIYDMIRFSRIQEMYHVIIHIHVKNFKLWQKSTFS